MVAKTTDPILPTSACLYFPLWSSLRPNILKVSVVALCVPVGVFWMAHFTYLVLPINVNNKHLRCILVTDNYGVFWGKYDRSEDKQLLWSAPAVWEPYRRLHIGEMLFFKKNRNNLFFRETFKTPALIFRTLSQNGVGWSTQILFY